MTRILTLLALLVACNGGKTDPADADTDTDTDADTDADTDTDDDGDGYRTDVDCNDADPDIHPDATEICDGVDNDCDGAVDDADDDLDTSTASSWFEDVDEDGYGGTEHLACADPSTDELTYVINGEDCNDADDAVHPAATEICNDVDDDCDGDIDAADATLDTSTLRDWYIDSDEDGHGDAGSSSFLGCSDPSDSALAYSPTNDDCDDTNDAIHPSATEVCNDIDDDCDGDIDDADDSLDSTTQKSWWIDDDEDGYGDADATVVRACHDPSESVAYVGNNEDCDDSTDAISPDATEVCNEVDDDCDGDIDDADSSLDASTATAWYDDDDGDGYAGGSEPEAFACADPTTSSTVYSTTSDDCDDANDDVHPDADEICNGIDDDCDSSTSEAGLATWIGSDGPVDMTELFEDDGGLPDPYPSEGAGDLHLCDGDFKMDLQVNYDLDLIGHPGSGTVSVTSNAGATMLVLPNRGSTVIVRDLTFINGLADGSTSTWSDAGGAVLCSGENTLTFDGVTFEANQANGSGGAVFLRGCKTTFVDSTFYNNYAAGEGGAVFATSAEVSFVTSHLAHNRADGNGGAIATDDSGAYGISPTLDLEDTLFDMNRGFEGGAIYLGSGTEGTCTGTSKAVEAGFTMNQSDSIAAIYLEGTGATWDSDTCDYGATQDNGPSDLGGSTWTASYDDDETFSCTDTAGCSP